MRRIHPDPHSPVAALACLPEVRSMMMMPFDPVWRNKVHQSWCCEFHYILKGSMAMVSKTGRRVTGTTGELLLVPSGDWHRDDYDDGDEFPRVFLLFFSWKAESQFWSLFPRSERQTLLVPANRDIAGMFDRIQTTLSSGTQTDELIIRTYVLTILLLIARTRQADSLCHLTLADASIRRQQAIMLAAKQYMDQHYQEFISLDRVADALKISPSYLSHVFSRENDFTLFEYLADLRMRQARLLLQEGNRSVQEIACAVGYDNVSYFSRAFRRHFGVPPRAMLSAPFVRKDPAHRRRRYGNKSQ